MCKLLVKTKCEKCKLWEKGHFKYKVKMPEKKSNSEQRKLFWEKGKFWEKTNILRK